MPAQPPPFTFSQVEAILAKLFGVADERRSTFLARLQQLQKLGLPRGTQVGRGARARYEWWQLAELMLFLDLLNCGIPPNLLRVYYGNGPGFFSLGNQGAIVERHPGTAEEGIKLILKFNALEHLRSSDQQRGEAPTDVVTFTRVGSDGVMKVITQSPGVVINVSRRLSELKAVVGQLHPELRGLDAFEYSARTGAMA